MKQLELSVKQLVCTNCKLSIIKQFTFSLSEDVNKDTMPTPSEPCSEETVTVTQISTIVQLQKVDHSCSQNELQSNISTSILLYNTIDIQSQMPAL